MMSVVVSISLYFYKLLWEQLCFSKYLLSSLNDESQSSSHSRTLPTQCSLNSEQHLEQLTIMRLWMGGWKEKVCNNHLQEAFSHCSYKHCTYKTDVTTINEWLNSNNLPIELPFFHTTLPILGTLLESNCGTKSLNFFTKESEPVFIH